MRIFRRTLIKNPKIKYHDCVYCDNVIYGEHYYIVGIIFDEFQYGRSHVECANGILSEELGRNKRMEQNKNLVDSWNSNNEVGVTVELTEDNGERTITKTRSEAWLLGGHTAVVMVEGRAGGYLLERIALAE